MTLRRALPLSLVLSLFAAMACKKDPTPTSAPAGSGAVVDAAAAPSAKATARPVASSGKGPMKLDAKQKVQFAAYQKGLEAGRKATKDAKYKEARDAFTAALKAKPGDARALGERGYASLMAKDYDAADDDLYKAANGVGDANLRAQIFFNLGLVREGRGLDATSAFALSNRLHATSAAQKKLGGKAACLVDIDRQSEANEKYADWLAFYKVAMTGDQDADDAKPPTSSADAKEALCASSKCDGAGPWIVSVYAWPHSQVLLVIDTKPGLSVAKLSESYAGRCASSGSATIVDTKGGALVVRAEEAEHESDVMCFPGNGDSHACTGKDGDEVERQSVCVEGVKIVTYSVFDVAKGVRTLRVTHDDSMEGLAKPGERPQVSVDAQGLTIKGPGCNESLPFGSK